MGKDIYHTISYQNNFGVAILISDEIDFRARKTNKDKEQHCIMVKESNHIEDKRILYVYATKTELQNT